MPRLELCAALTGAQLAKLLVNELTLPIQEVTHWTDSTTVLHWLRSESCHFKVFVDTRVAEIQELTNLESWRYVDSARNPADDLTRGKNLKELNRPNRWIHGPQFLLQPPNEWPSNPSETPVDDNRVEENCRLWTNHHITACDRWSQVHQLARIATSSS